MLDGMVIIILDQHYLYIQVEVIVQLKQYGHLKDIKIQNTIILQINIQENL